MARVDGSKSIVDLLIENAGGAGSFVDELEAGLRSGWVSFGSAVGPVALEGVGLLEVDGLSIGASRDGNCIKS